MNIDADHWPVLSTLLDEALDLDPSARAAWLERLAMAQPGAAPALRRLLSAHATSDTTDVLQRLPPLAAVRPDERLAPGGRIGPYRLIRALGSGGMADVWLAERADGAFTRDVALKLPRINRLRHDLAARFARERDILARLEHPNIARLYDAGIAAGDLPYLAMEYVDGQPINEYCDQRALDLAARLRLFAQVLDAVQYAHASLVIHRDLKPSNILVNAGGQVRLLDFGIAKLLAEDDTARETQLTLLAGRALTPDYASPEQIKGEPLTIASDVYSLGVVLYELLAGARPYRLTLKSAAQLEQAIVATDAPRPSSIVSVEAARARGTSVKRLARALTGDLETIALKALAKKPTERYAAVASFGDDLQRHRDGRPVLARSASWRSRTLKFVARNRLAVSAGCGVATALVLGVALALWQAHQARNEQRRAEQVKSFIASILVDVDPNVGTGGRVPAAALLERAAERVAAELKDEPRVAAELSAIIGQSLMALGEAEPAQRFLSASTRNGSRLDPDDPLMLRLRRLAIIADLERGAIDAAERELPALLESLRAGGPLLSEDLVHALYYMGSIDASRGRIEASLARHREAVETGELRLGARHRATIMARSQYSNILVLAGRVREALEVAERGTADARAIYRRPHPMISGLERRLGDALIRNDRPRDAADVLARVLEDERAVHGTDERIAVALARNYLGLALAAGGRLHQGVDHLRGAFETTQRLNPGDTGTLVMLRSTLAGALVAARRPREALSLLDADAAAASPFARLIRCNAFALAGDFAGATLELNALEADADRLPPLLRSRLHRCAASAARLRGDAQAAADRARAGLELLDPKATRLAEIAGARAELGLALLELGEVNAAAEQLVQAREGFKQAQIETCPALVEIELALARIAYQRGDRSAALQAARDVEAFWQAFNPQAIGAREAAFWRARIQNDGRGVLPRATEALLLPSSYPLHRRWLAQR